MYPPESTTPTQAEAPLSLRAPRALAALYSILWNHDLVHAVTSRYGTWDELAQAAYAELHQLLGPDVQRVASLSFPQEPPPAPQVPDGVVMLSRYSLTYPPALREVPNPPCVLYVRGTLPLQPAVVIGGALHPSPSGLAISRMAARAAAALGRPVIVQLQDGVGVAALQAALEAKARTVVVLAHGIDHASRFSQLLDEVVEGGGAVITEVPLGVPYTETYSIASARLACALGHSTVLAEVGRHISSGAPLARAAIDLGRYLIVPDPQQPWTPESALGLEVLSRTRAFSPAWYGTSPRIAARVRAGLSPADAVVTDEQDLMDAIDVSISDLAPAGTAAAPPAGHSPTA